ncbi:hypothetical protein A176_007259 [Myxococcus hansupus]|uniref:Uncharacterized protein n=1 Tax=Pseudomyxococcus hansupus TaxID=1297742 RepID=A0A0H4XPP9_9BACT|nr:hypothetical protein A176_007259 [Myxococcus hansupus]
MLNAFRHHGERDTQNAKEKLGLSKCSTPSGITASATERVPMAA